MDLTKARRDPWVWAQLGLVLLVALAAPLVPRHVNLGAADFLLNRIDPVWIRVLGGVLLLGGGFLASWGVRSLGPNLTPGTEPMPSGALVTTGAYAYARHPIYGGAVLLLSGYALAWSNWTLALIVGGVAWHFFKAKARREERWLLSRFPSYSTYLRHVPRMLL